MSDLEIVCLFDARTKGNTSASVAHLMATPFKAPEVSLETAEQLANSRGYELVNFSVHPKKPRYRLLKNSVLVPSNQYGGGLALYDVVQYLYTQSLPTVYSGDPDWMLESEQLENLALFDGELDLEVLPESELIKIREQEAFERDQQARLDMARMQMEASLARDCDRANFSNAGW